MIPIKIITREEAVRFGLTEDQEDTGSGDSGALCVGKKESDGSVTIVEKSIFKKNGEKELIFMTEERKAHFKRKGSLKKYIKQFKKIPKNVKNLN